jgi:hypothetical protein
VVGSITVVDAVAVGVKGGGRRSERRWSRIISQEGGEPEASIIIRGRSRRWPSVSRLRRCSPEAGRWKEEG